MIAVGVPPSSGIEYRCGMRSSMKWSQCVTGGAVPGHRRHLRVFPRLELFLGLGPVRDLGPDFGDEGDAPRVREPLRCGHAGRNVAHADGLAAARADHVDLRLRVVASLGDEGDPAAVRAPGGLGLVALHAGEPLRLAARRCDQEEVGVALVVLRVESRDRVDRLLAVRGNGRCADALQLPHRLWRQRRRLGADGDRQGGGHGREQAGDRHRHHGTPRAAARRFRGARHSAGHGKRHANPVRRKPCTLHRKGLWRTVSACGIYGN